MNEKKKSSREKKNRNFSKWFKYFSMKWRFRLQQIQGLFSLITYAAILALGYYKFIDPKEEFNQILGILLFTLAIFIVFVIGGYLYDRVFKLWSETQTVNVERNPYTYVPSPKEQWLSMAVYGYLFNSLSQIADKLEIKLENEAEIKLFLSSYLSMNAKTPDYSDEIKKLVVISDKIKESFIDPKDKEEFDKIIAKLSNDKK